MSKLSGQLTVFFENPFWIGVFEQISDGRLSVCKVTFGAEPKDYDIWEFILRNYDKLEFSAAVEITLKQKADNPKRRQRNARNLIKNTGVGTKSQQALQMQRWEQKMERKHKSREQRDAEKQRQFELKQQKRKEKHRGH